MCVLCLRLQVQVRKMEQQLHQKEDMGEVLHVVDFDQLKIENQQYLDRIEERNTELLRLKAATGKAVQVVPEQCCQTPLIPLCSKSPFEKSLS